MLNKSLRKTAYVVMASALGSSMIVGCIDHDYDLSKDMDLNVTLGGEELNLPVCSTAPLTLKDILELDDDSSIKEAKQGEYGLNAGDYVLVQAPENESEPSSVKIAEVHINDLGGSKTAKEQLTVIEVAGTAVIRPENPLTTNLSLIDNKVDTRIKSLEWADTDVEVSVRLSYTSTAGYDGILTIIDGATATFSDQWIMDITDPATRNLGIVVDENHKNILRFTKEISFSGGDYVDLIVNVKQITFPSQVSQGQGLYAPGMFDMQVPVTFDCDIELENFDTSFDIATISLEAITEVTKADLKRVRGKVNPDITVDPTIVDINDIPDFLSDGKNSLDVLNPQIRLDVTNTSPVTAYVGADIIASYPDGSTETISIGSNLGQAHKKDITIIGNGISRLCLRTSDETIDGYTPVVVEDLPRLLRTIPEKIEFTNININVDDEEAVTFDLGDGAEYSFKTDYEAIVPLQFGPDMELHYSTEADGWDTDLDSYNFDTVHLSMDVDNQTPLGMTPEIYAVDENNEKINDVTCTFTPADNSIKANGVSTISADLKSNAGNLGRMKSIQIEFTAKTGAEGAGKTLNANQTLTLRNIKVSIRGGLTVDLNEL